MSNVPILDSTGATRRVDTFQRDESGTIVETPAVALVNPTNGAALDLATQTTLAAIQVIAAAVQSAVEALNSKTAAVNTSAIAGTVEVANDAGNPLPVSGALTNAELRAAAVPVSALALPLPSGAAAEATLAALLARINSRASSPLADSEGIVTRQAPQDSWAVSFTGTAGSLVAPQMVQRAWGAGVTVSQSGGNLVVGAGTSANAEFLARSVQSFRGAFIARHRITLSQRIAGNNFVAMLADRVADGRPCTINSATSITVNVPGHGLGSANVGQSMFVGAIVGAAGVPGRYAIAAVPDANNITFTVAGWPASGSCTVDLFGWNYIRTIYNGTSATSAGVDAQRLGWNSGDTTVTVNTTASPGHVMQMAADGRNLYFSDTLVASSTTPTVSTRGSRIENLIDDDVELHFYLWSFNATAAPASGTTWTVGFLSVEDTCNLPVYLAGVRPAGGAAALPVAFPTAQSVTLTANTPVLAAGANLAADVGLQLRANATGAASPASVTSPASPTAQSIKGSAGKVVGWALVNLSAGTRFVKFFNSSTVTLGTTAAAFEIAIPAGQAAYFECDVGAAFTTAIQIAVTTARGLTDNTGGGALGDVVGVILFA